MTEIAIKCNIFREHLYSHLSQWYFSVSSFEVMVPESSNLYADRLEDPAIQISQCVLLDLENLKGGKGTYPNPPPPVPITHPGIWGCQWHSLIVSM